MATHHTKDKGDLGVAKAHADLVGLGVHSRSMDKSAVDVICIYCPDTDDCYYVRPQDFGQSASLRVTASRNNQQVGVHFASDFRELPI